MEDHRGLQTRFELRIYLSNSIKHSLFRITGCFDLTEQMTHLSSTIIMWDAKFIIPCTIDSLYFIDNKTSYSKNIRALLHFLKEEVLKRKRSSQ